MRKEINRNILILFLLLRTQFNGEHGSETNGSTKPQATGLTTIISVQCLKNGKKD